MACLMCLPTCDACQPKFCTCPQCGGRALIALDTCPLCHGALDRKDKLAGLDAWCAAHPQLEQSARARFPDR